MSDRSGLLQTESSANSEQRIDQTLPPGSALDLYSIESLARKIEGQTTGEPHEGAKEIIRLVSGLIEQYQQTAHRWAVNE